MRFEQLKRSPNVIVKKRLYKSGKNWVVMSTLSFIGGAILLGASQTNIVKADVDPNASGNATEQFQPSDNTNADSNSNIKVQGGNSDTGYEMPKQTQASGSNGLATQQDDSENNGIDAPSQKAAANNNDGESKDVAPATTPVNDKLSRAAVPQSDEGSEPEDTSSPILTSDNWELDGNGTLHFKSNGLTLNTSKDADGNYEAYQENDDNADYADKVTSVVFDGPVTAGTSVSGLFKNLNNLTKIERLDWLDTTNTTDFSEMFSSCSSLPSINLSTFDTSNGTDFSEMFAGCSALKSLDIYDLDVSSGTNFMTMFAGCSALKSLNSSNLDASKVWDISSGTNFLSMFAGCSALKSLDLSGWKLAAGKDFTSMFSGCSSLQNLNLSNWDTSSVTTLNGMFAGCTSLQDLNLSNWNTSSVATLYSMFAGCTSLKSLDISSWNMSGMSPNGNGGFLGGTKLDTLILSSKDILGESSGLIDRDDPTDKTTGWTSDAYEMPDTGRYTTDQLNSMYDGSKDGKGKLATWHVYPGMVNFKVEYVDKTDPDNPVTYTYNDSARAGSVYELKRYMPGYEMIESDKDEVNVTVPSENNKTIVYNTSLTPYPLVTLKLHESYLDGNKTKSIQIPMKVYAKISDYPYSLQLLNDGKEWDNVDLDKSTVLFGTTGGPSFNNMAGAYGPRVSSVKDLINAVLSHVIASPYGEEPGSPILVNPGYAGGYFGFDIVYKKGGIVHPSTHSTTAPTSETTDFNQNISTFGDRPAVQEYNDYGNAIDDKIAPNTDWHSDKKMVRNGITYYSVNDDTWVKDSDVYIYFVNNADVRTYQGKFVPLTDGDNSKTLDRGLQAGSDWYTDRIALLNGEKYYRVATSEFVKATAVYEYKADPQTVQTNKNTTVYDELGNVVNIKLPFSEYKSDINMTINGVTYYRIATNLFVKQA